MADYEEGFARGLWHRICSGEEERVLMIWRTLDEARQRRILTAQLQHLRLAETEHFVQATGLLKLAAPASACHALVEAEVAALRDATEYAEIARAALEILWEIKLHAFDQRHKRNRPLFASAGGGGIVGGRNIYR